MTLIENINTYVSIDYADSYLASHYMPFNPIKVHYSVLTENEKAAYLLVSMQEIERLPFVGRKRIANQPLAFPRLRNSSTGLTSTYMSAFGGNSEECDIPECIKEAQVENAIAILLRDISAVSDKQFMTMQSLGAVKNTKYNKREAGDLGFGDDITGGDTMQKKCPIASRKAYTLLRNWLGGITVC